MWWRLMFRKYIKVGCAKVLMLPSTVNMTMSSVNYCISFCVMYHYLQTPATLNLRMPEPLQPLALNYLTPQRPYYSTHSESPPPLSLTSHYAKPTALTLFLLNTTTPLPPGRFKWTFQIVCFNGLNHLVSHSKEKWGVPAATFIMILYI